VRFVRGTIVHDMVRDAVRAAINRTKAAATPYPVHLKQAEPSPSDFFEEKAPPISREEMRAAFRLQSPVPPQLQPQQKSIDLGFQNRTGEPPAPHPQLHNEMPAPMAERVEHWEDATTKNEPESYAGADSTAPLHFGKHTGCLGMRVMSSPGTNLKPAQNLTLIADEIYPMGQLHNSFIIAADRSGLLLIDQHVAHERILFEQHWHALRSKSVELQQMLIPETFDLTPAQSAALEQISPELEVNGFEIGRLSGRTIATKAVPAFLAAGASQALLVELLDAIEEDRRGLTLDEVRAEIAASLACRAAIKINMPLAPEKMRWLIDQLLKMENPATCPHGRPIILRITSREIEKGFQRI
jgi:DNA mismatch repair protein MutL